MMSWSTNSYAPSSNVGSNEPEWHLPTIEHTLEAIWTASQTTRLQGAYSSTLLDDITVKERHSSSLLIQQDTEPVGQRQTQWDDLSTGVQWAVLKILCENDVPTNPPQTPKAFSFVVSAVLHLKRRQIQSFLSAYVDEYETWQKFEKTAATINWPDIIRLATSHQMPLHQLLPKNRPRLSTDSISPEAVRNGCSFLRSVNLHNFAERLTDWIGVNIYGDFIGLAVESEILRDYLDGKSIRKAVILGWIDLDQIRRNLAYQRKENGLVTEVRTTGIFSDDFEGQPYPAHGFTKEFEKLGAQPRKANAKSSQKARRHVALEADCASDGAGCPAGREKTQIRTRMPTPQETRETGTALNRLITLPDGAWRNAISGSVVGTHLEHEQPSKTRRTAKLKKAQPASHTSTASPNVQLIRRPATPHVRAAPLTQSPTTPAIDEGTNMASRNLSHKSEASLSNSNAGSRRMQSARPGPACPKSHARKGSGSNEKTPSTEDYDVRYSEVAEQTLQNTGTMFANSKTKNRGFAHSKSSFVPIERGSATPESLPPHQQLRATAIANRFSQSPSESPRDYTATHNPLKRNRKPSRRLRDNLESDTDYKPESDENPQPMKKQRRNVVPKKTTTGRRHSQLDGTVSETPSPRLRLQEVGRFFSISQATRCATDASQLSISTQPSEEINEQITEQAKAKPLRLNLTKLPQGRAGARAVFGTNLHSPITLAGTGRLASADYAWSAQTAYFAWVATEAKFALHVTANSDDSWARNRSPPTMRKIEEAKTEMSACEKIFHKHEEELATIGGQDADSASYAGLSDVATYAMYADRATYIL